MFNLRCLIIFGCFVLINSEIVLESRAGSYSAGARRNYDSISGRVNQPAIHHQNNYFQPSHGYVGNIQPQFIPYGPILSLNPYQQFPQPFGYNQQFQPVHPLGRRR